VRAEAYGPVVVRPSGSTWRGSKSQGGGCLYDYAAHAIDLVNYLVGPPTSVSGTVLNSLFSREVEDEVYSTLHFSKGACGQLAVNWSDDSHRRMTTRIGVWGTNGRINLDRQECQIYLREQADAAPELRAGWTVQYTTGLTAPVWFYLRGEEYSAQIDYFVQAIKERRTENVISFESALATDRVVQMLLRDAANSRAEPRGPRSAQSDRNRSGFVKSIRKTFSG
jgi:predicted dehydrogenase